MERKNAWEKYPEGKKEKRYFSLQRITENLFLSAKQSVNVPQNLQKEPRKQVL